MFRALTDPRQPWVSIGALALGGLIVLVGAPRLDDSPSLQGCRADGGLATIPDLQEASGLAASTRVPDRFWSHNDSNDPILFALDAKGAVSGKVTVSGATVEDWEAVAVGPCKPGGSCIYVADIGDNDAKRTRVTIYRATEPDAPGSTIAATAIHAKYPDGAHDAEALLVDPRGQLFIVTKGETGPAALYRFPGELKAGATITLERVGEPRGSNPESDRITDGAVSADGQTVVLRTKQALIFYRADDFFAGTWREERRQSLEAIGEPQGEGLAFGPGGALFVAGEGGGKSAPGTFARLSCPAP